MHALTVRQPWAELIVAAKKSIEIRTWWPRVQFPMLVAIHAGTQVDQNAPRELWTAKSWSSTGRGERLGGIIGVVRFVDQIRFGSDPYYRRQGGGVRMMSASLGRERWEGMADQHLNPLDWWADNLVGFRFDQPVRFPALIPCRGKQGLWVLPAEVAEQLP